MNNENTTAQNEQQLKQYPYQQKVSFTVFTNTKGDLNKKFSLDSNNNVIKESNAFMTTGTATVPYVTNLQQFGECLDTLQSNQAIGLGVINDNVYNANICVKGMEDAKSNTISRSKDFFSWNEEGSLFIADIDDDEQMPEHMKVNTPDECHSMLIKIDPNLANIPMMISYSSSYGIKNAQGECVSCKGGFHCYWFIRNATEKNIRKYVDELEKSAVAQDLFYIKIFKDGKTSMRIPFDLSPLKSASSRLIFEAKPTCIDGLYQDRPARVYYNMEVV